MVKGANQYQDANIFHYGKENQEDNLINLRKGSGSAGSSPE
jgi:hypothetical protein